MNQNKTDKNVYNKTNKQNKIINITITSVKFFLENANFLVFVITISLNVYLIK